MTLLANSIDTAVSVLRQGGLVAFPTETVYGLGADARNAQAVDRIFKVKGRPSSHPLIVHIGDAADLQEWAMDVPKTARLLAERFWPGPMTLVLWRHRHVPLNVTGGLDTIALRVPQHPVASELLASFGSGIAAPSANRFGSVSPTLSQHVYEDLGSFVDFILDGGPCDVGVESTIIDLTKNVPVILRPGGITREELEVALGYPVPEGLQSDVRVPGQHPTHYSPRAKVHLVSPQQIESESNRLHTEGFRVGVLLPMDIQCSFSSETVSISIPRSEEEYARKFYESLRELDRKGCDIIVAALPRETGIGFAIADRLRRAAGLGVS